MSNRNRSKKFNSLRKAVAQEHQRRSEVRESSELRMTFSNGKLSFQAHDPASNQSNPEAAKPKGKVYQVNLIEVVYPEGEEHEDNRPFFRTSLEGEIYRALFKTGSDVSILGPKVTQRLTKYLEPTNDVLKSSGFVIPTAGVVKMKMDIGSDVKTFDFYAATEPVFHDIILGLDFCNAWNWGLGCKDFNINDGPWQEIDKFLFKATPIMTPQSIGWNRKCDADSSPRDSCFGDMETQSGSNRSESSDRRTVIKTEKIDPREMIASAGTEALVDKVLLLMQKLEMFSVETQEAVLNAIFRDKQPINDDLLI